MWPRAASHPNPALFAVALSGALLPQARAQTPAAPDTAYRVVLNEVFAGRGSPPAFVVLGEGLAYRLELEPADAIVNIRPRTHPTQRPLVLTPLDGSSVGRDASESRAFLIVPRSSDEYRVDVFVYADQPVRVRIIHDPRESARWQRLAQESRGRPPAGVAVRAVWFPRLRSSPVFSPSGSQSRLVSGTGIEGCLAVVPRGSWLKGPVGGCVLSVTRLWLDDGTGAFVIGASPRLLMRTAPGFELSLSSFLGMGGSVSDGNEATYYLGAIGLQYARSLGRWGLDVESSMAMVRSTFETSLVNGTSDVTPRVAAGLSYRF